MKTGDRKPGLNLVLMVHTYAGELEKSEQDQKGEATFLFVF
jgi:hypothetical protein